MMQFVVRLSILWTLLSSAIVANADPSVACPLYQPIPSCTQEHLVQLTVNYFLSSGFCADTGGSSTFSCYYAFPQIPNGYTVCEYSDSLHRELLDNWSSKRDSILEYANSSNDSCRPTVSLATQETRICDSAYMYYYGEDNEIVYIKGWRDILRYVVYRLNSE